jgi:hypothetical protein
VIISRNKFVVDPSGIAGPTGGKLFGNGTLNIEKNSKRKNLIATKKV